MARVLTGATLLVIASTATATSGAAATAAPVASSGTAVAQTANSRTAPPAANRLNGHRILIEVKNKRLGKLATVKIKGVKGRAKGATGSVRIRKRTTIKGVNPGMYKITAKRITKSARVAKPVVKKRWVKVTRKRGAMAVFRYRATATATPAPPPPVNPGPTQVTPGDPSVGHLNGDVLAKGQTYCADGYVGHTNYFGTSSAEWVADINFYRDSGSPFYAPSAGSVSQVTSAGSSSWGNSVVWTSADGSQKLHLAHLSSVTATGTVAAGAQVGTIGSTGASSGAHLHISRAVNGSPAPVVLSGVTIAPVFDAPLYGMINPCNGTTYKSAGPSH